MVKWESEQDVENAVRDIRGEMERQGPYKRDERAMRIRSRAVPALQTTSANGQGAGSDAMHYFQERGGGA